MSSQAPPAIDNRAGGRVGTDRLLTPTGTPVTSTTSAGRAVTGTVAGDGRGRRPGQTGCSVGEGLRPDVLTRVPGFAPVLRDGRRERRPGTADERTGATEPAGAGPGGDEGRPGWRGSPHGINRTWSAGPRPPPTTAVTTASCPRSPWILANPWAARSSASVTPPQNPTW
jgi:hypothetical protein